MNIKGKFIALDRLSAYAASSARLYKPTGFISGKKAAMQSARAYSDIEAAHARINVRFGGKASMPAACEWLLDNRYLAQREYLNASKAISSAKSLRVCGEGVVITELAGALLRSGRGKLSEIRIREFLTGAQDSFIIPRTELCLFPAALRLALISELSSLCSELCVTSTPEELSEDMETLFTSLRLLTELDMRRVIERVDQVEKLLMSDPAGIYPEMDDESRTSYRDRLLELAGDEFKEYALAKSIIKQCKEAKGDARHVGYHLFTVPNGKTEKERSPALYIFTNIFLTLFLSLLCGFLSDSVLAALLLLIPVSELTKSLIDYVILLSVKPKRMPRLSLEDGVPAEGKTVCVISALLTNGDGTEKLARRLEEYRLSNRSCGENLLFGILADLPESKTVRSEQDTELISKAAGCIDALNSRYGGGFFLFTRHRSPDKSRGVFCGYERKRGAVLELARLITGRKNKLRISAGDAGGLKGTKFILTLDSDTRLTPDSAKELIGTMLHPLNRPSLDRDKGLVTGGHGILHPRMTTELSSSTGNDFTMIFAGQGGCEPYSSVCGELYTDLFDRGGFSGKGLIDADALIFCTEAHIPDGKILSHDALEGAYLRGGYLSDVEFTDSFPASPISYYRRAHRWARGDWQNAGFILDLRSGLPDIERWKLFDSLRRSLVSPFTFLAIILNLIIIESGLTLAATAAVLSLCSGLLISLIESAVCTTDDIRLRFHSRTMKGMKNALSRTLLRLWLLPYEAWIGISAILTSLWRMLISRKKLLEWETSAQSDMKKRGIGAYCTHMWSAILSGIALIFLSKTLIGIIVGLFWFTAPLMAFSLTLEGRPVSGLNGADREYLKGCAEDIFGYFKSMCTVRDSFLPPDNFQEQPPIGAAHRTSPTNIGLALLSELAAVDLGIDKDGAAFEMIEKMLTSLEKMPRPLGHFCNWYDTRSLKPLEPAYISTVDSGNLYASLISLKYGLTEYGKSELSERVDALLRDMDMSVLFDESRGLFRIGIDLSKSTPSQSHYDLMASESRLTSYLSVAKGYVPRSHWRRLSRAMLRLNGYQGMASWSGTMFEYLMPELFLPLSRDSLIYESAKYCIYVQKRRVSPTKVWGISESAFFSLDPALNYRYKAHGCASLALKRGQDSELVISPYSSFLALLIEPKSAVRNLRRLEALGAKGRFGFIEAIDYTPSRCKSENGEQVRSYMVHHLGMSMLAVANCLKDNCVSRRFMRSPEMNAYRCLLDEKLPTRSAVLEQNGNDGGRKPEKNAVEWVLRGEDIDFENPDCAVLSNGVYSVMLTESGISSASCRDMTVYKAPFHQIGEGHGAELSIKCGDEEISLLPEPNDAKRCFMWELSDKVCSYTLNHEGFISKTSVAVSAQDRGELRYIELTAIKELRGTLCLSFEPVLADSDDYVNHPAFWRLGMDAYMRGSCLMLHRLPRGRQEETWLCLACDKDAGLSADRISKLGRLSSPFVKAEVRIALKADERFSLRFALCLADDADSAYLGAQHMLGTGLGEFGNMPAASAMLMSMDERGIASAMELIRPLWFRTASEKALISKQRLWQYGLSGDLPIICCPPEEFSRESAESLTKQFCLLKSCGIDADLVFVTDEGGDYNRPACSRILDTLHEIGLESLMGISGGIRALPMSALSDVTAGSVCVIGTNKPERVTGIQYRYPAIKRMPPSAAPKYSWTGKGEFKFYVNRSLPARCWSHVLTNGSFGYLATDSGCGNMWYKNAREMRINRWVNDPCALTGPETIEFVGKGIRCSVFADGGYPCRVSYGFGYATWEKAIGSIGIKTTAFIPCGIDARVMIIELWGNAAGQIEWFNELIMSDNDNDSIAVSCSYVNSAFRAESSRSYYEGLRFYASASVSPLGVTCSRNAWVKGETDGRNSSGSDPVFAAVYPAAKELILVCGCCDEETIQWLCKPNNARSALEQLKSGWSYSLNRLTIKTAYTDLEHYLNGWAAYQTVACRLMGRCSLYQSGGAFGFRDQLQDAVNMMLLSPKFSHEQILACCAHQYIEGDVMHWWHFAEDGDKGVRTRCSDDLLWLVWALCEYVEKTGDSEICRLKSYYVNSSPLSSEETERYETPIRSACEESVLEHARRAVDCCLKRGTGAHGLLLFGSCDWNDGMNRVGGESVWLTWFFAHTVRRFSDLLVLLCENDSGKYRACAEKLGKCADRAWDGSWYLRGYWPDGEKLGSHENLCCKIDSISQSWAAFCSEASNSRIDTALSNAVDILFDRNSGIIKLFDPPFSGECRDPGYIESYGAGFRENGGQYTHAAIWLAMACIRRGREKDGFEILRALLPENHDMKKYLAEPFVLAADVSSSPEHMGEAGWTWYTGSSGWYFRVVYEELLGLKLWNGRLYIRPSLPDGAEAISVTFRDCLGNNRNVTIKGSEITLDGEKYDGKGIPI